MEYEGLDYIPENGQFKEDVEDSYEYVDVVKNTYAISREKTKTCYLNPCVGVIIYNPETKTVGVIHIKESRKLEGVISDLELLLSDLKSQGSQWNQKSIILHILGGWKDENLHTNTKNALLKLGFTAQNIKTDIYTPHETPNLYTMEGGSLLGESSPISVMFNPQDGSLHKIVGKLLLSKTTNTGSILNPLWWGSIHKTPDKRTL